MTKRMLRWLGVMACCCLMVSGAEAQDQSESRTPVKWAQAPDGDLASNLLPGFAALIGVSGSVKVQCLLIVDGHPFNCRAMDETPVGLGFGSAARLVVASGQLNTGRVNGEPVPSTMRTVVRFSSPEVGEQTQGWVGPEPTPTALALARELIESGEEGLPEVGDRMDGLDHDRRAVVGPWIEELLPMSSEDVTQIRTLQIARLFGEGGLRRIKAGKYVERPSEEAIMSSRPTYTLEQIENLKELRRRYCDRYACDL